ncbi:MAG: M20 family metallopeptidase [Acidimicrobiia bacterium]|nr:M20 family metallopeptidase [Acidimicrobiia bacterium]
MVHPSPRDVVDPTSLAVSHLKVAFHGKEAHASAFPEEGINALDGFVQSYVNISTLRQHILSTDKDPRDHHRRWEGRQHHPGPDPGKVVCQVLF